MSAVDVRAEFLSDIADWFCQLFATRIMAPLPKNSRVKQKFIHFVEDRCSEVGCWKLGDETLGELFSEFLDDLANW